MEWRKIGGPKCELFELDSDFQTPGKQPMASNFSEKKSVSETAIRLEHVVKSFGGRCILRDVNLTISAGSLTFLVGRSGAGKSVLSRCSVGLIRADSGRIFLFDDEVTRLSETGLIRLRSRVPYVVQESALVDWLTVKENVATALMRSTGKRLDEKSAMKAADEALRDVGIADAADALPRALSSGDRKLAAIARAVALHPRAIFYDEPTTGLDMAAARRVDDMIRRHAENGVTSVVVSHDLESIRRIADEVALLEEGVIAFSGTSEAFFAAEKTHPEVHRFFHQAEK